MASSSTRYAVLQETNGKECESWMYFIKYDGNEEALEHLQAQIDNVEEWYILDDLSSFDLDLKHLVSETTAKEMTRLTLNRVAPHRKFDGKMKTIEIGIKEKDSNDRRLVRFFKKLGIGRIEEYVEDEDDPTESECSSDDGDAMEDSSSSSGTEYEYGLSDTESESENDAMEEDEVHDPHKRGAAKKPFSPPKKNTTTNPTKATIDRIKEEIKAKQAAKAQADGKRKK